MLEASIPKKCWDTLGTLHTRRAVQMLAGSRQRTGVVVLKELSPWMTWATALEHWRTFREGGCHND